MSCPEISFSLRVAGDALNVAEVTQILGCPPSDARQKDDPHKSGNRTTYARTGVWSLKAKPDDADFDFAVTQLLAKMTADLDVWSDLASRFSIDLFCGVFLRSINQGFTLLPATLKQLSDRSITLSLDIYGRNRTD